jgi:pimeloyl-ACP methyl ester carboxylesterase
VSVPQVDVNDQPSTGGACELLQYQAPFNDGLVRVVDAGPRSAPTLLALHGFGARADRRVPAMKWFSSHGFRTVAIDLPGHGHSTKGASVEVGATRVAEGLAATGIGGCEDRRGLATRAAMSNA